MAYIILNRVPFAIKGWLQGWKCRVLVQAEWPGMIQRSVQRIHMHGMTRAELPRITHGASICIHWPSDQRIPVTHSTVGWRPSCVDTGITIITTGSVEASSLCPINLSSNRPDHNRPDHDLAWSIYNHSPNAFHISIQTEKYFSLTLNDLYPYSLRLMDLDLCWTCAELAFTPMFTQSWCLSTSVIYGADCWWQPSIGLRGNSSNPSPTSPLPILLSPGLSLQASSTLDHCWWSHWSS